MLTKTDLDQMRCQWDHADGTPCDHDELVFHGACHMKAPTWVTYSDGALRIECSVCGKLIAEVAVA